MYEDDEEDYHTYENGPGRQVAGKTAGQKGRKVYKDLQLGIQQSWNTQNWLNRSVAFICVIPSANLRE